MLRDSQTLGKHFLHSAYCGSIFPAKVVEMLKEMVVRWQERSGEYGRWGKTWKRNSFNFWSAGCAMCDWVVLWRIGPFQLTNANCRHCSFYFKMMMIIIFFDFRSAHEAFTPWAFSSFQFASNAKWPQHGQHWVLQQLLVQLWEGQLGWRLLIGCWQLPMAGHYACLLCKTSWTTTVLYCSLAGNSGLSGTHSCISNK